VSVQEASSETYDLVVVGAGINGTGIARDAALRGLKVLLLDKADIAAGTTSWSSRLIHGGLRYLEHAEIPLVHESLQERETLLRIAPHLVFPLPLTLPIYDYSPRGPLLIRAGMMAYDALSWNKSLPRHRMYSRDGALAHERGLNPQGLKGAARYYDAQVEFPERLSVENALDAAGQGATVVTGATATGIKLEAGVVRGIRFTIEGESGERTAQTRAIVNVAGPWVDDVLEEAGIANQRQPLLGVTKGTHIVVCPFPGAPADALYVEARSDGRPYFIIPWNGLYLIGTTDERYDGDPDDVVPTEAEIAYLLEETNGVIPSAGLTRESIRYAYAGLRPLPYQEEGSESGITRRHIIHDHRPAIQGLLSIIGGKLTTFRNLSEHVIDRVGEMLVRSMPSSTTAGRPLPGAVAEIGSFTADFVHHRPNWMSEQSAAYLVRVYGARAVKVLQLAVDDESLRAVVSPSTGAIGATVTFAFSDEHARTLSDAIMRRSMVGYGPDAGFEAMDAAADLAAWVKGWDTERKQFEIERHVTYMQRFLPVVQRS
jgi:glycerol-3-phosphate dehydrogenase